MFGQSRLLTQEFRRTDFSSARTIETSKRILRILNDEDCVTHNPSKNTGQVWKEYDGKRFKTVLITPADVV